MNMKRNMRLAVRASALLLLVVFAGACEGLGVTNPNQPDRERALATSGDVESLIVSSFNAYFDVSQSNFVDVTTECGDNTAYMAVLNAMADQTTSSWSNYGFARTTAEPRREFPNSTANEDSCLATDPWFRSYQGLAAVASGLRAIDEGVEIGDGGADTPRARAWGKFTQGLLHGMLGLLFDKAFIVDETTDLVDEAGNAIALPFASYQEMTAAAVGYLQEAVSIASGNTFTTPATWLNGTSLTNGQLAALARSYVARFTIRNTRSVAERSGLDWSSLLNNEINQGHTFDLALQGDEAAWWSGLKVWATMGGVGWQLAMVDLKTVGPADQSGAYQNWINTPPADRQPFDVVTPDGRIPQPVVIPGADESNGCADGLDLPQCGNAPAYIGYHEDTFLPATRGTYQLSNYTRYEQWYGPICNAALPDESFVGSVCEFTQRDLAFLKAEALWRTGDAQGGADIINQFREPEGELPPATANGVQGQTDCVPRTPDGSCGDFLDVLVYEKGLAIMAEHAGDMWADKRGWGRLTPGTLIQLPVPARELETLALEIYTFGGSSGGAAPVIVPGDLNSVLVKVKWDLERMQAIEAEQQRQFMRAREALRSRVR